MGYRSEWKLALRGKKQDVDDILAWMHEQSELDDEPSEEDGRSKSELYEYLLWNGSEAESKTDGDNKTAVFYNDWSKCYDTWDNVIEDIIEKCGNKVACAYLRVGDDHDDIVSTCAYSETNGYHIRIRLIREIGDVLHD